MPQNTRYTSKTNYSSLAVKIQANAAILYPTELLLNVVVFKARNSDLYMAKLIRPVVHKTFMTTSLLATSNSSLEKLYWKSIKGVTNLRMKSWWRWKTSEEKARLRKEREEEDAADKRLLASGVGVDVVRAKRKLKVGERRAFDAAMRELMGIPAMQAVMLAICGVYQDSRGR